MNVRARIRSAVVGTLSAAAQATGPANCRRIRAVLGDVLARVTPPGSDVDEVQTASGPLKLFAFGETTRWRTRSFFTKEPETLEWVDSFEPGSVLWDVGANVGLYSLYAALTRGCTVVSFEPGAANYFVLNRNIELNGLGDRVTAYCVAVGDGEAFGHLNMTDTAPGAAMSTFGQCTDYQGNTYTPAFRQGAPAYSLDALARRPELPFPNHLKIDVDGLELSIVRAGPAVFADPRLHSVSIELDDARPEHAKEVEDILESAGMSMVWKRHAPMFDGGRFEKTNNVCFRRGAGSATPPQDSAQLVAREEGER